MNNCKYNNGPKSSVEGTKISVWGFVYSKHLGLDVTDTTLTTTEQSCILSVEFQSLGLSDRSETSLPKIEDLELPKKLDETDTESSSKKDSKLDEKIEEKKLASYNHSMRCIKSLDTRHLSTLTTQEKK